MRLYQQWLSAVERTRDDFRWLGALLRSGSGHALKRRARRRLCTYAVQYGDSDVVEHVEVTSGTSIGAGHRLYADASSGKRSAAAAGAVYCAARSIHFGAPHAGDDDVSAAQHAVPRVRPRSEADAAEPRGDAAAR